MSLIGEDINIEGDVSVSNFFISCIKISVTLWSWEKHAYHIFLPFLQFRKKLLGSQPLCSTHHNFAVSLLRVLLHRVVNFKSWDKQGGYEWGNDDNQYIGFHGYVFSLNIHAVYCHHKAHDLSCI